MVGVGVAIMQLIHGHYGLVLQIMSWGGGGG